LTDYLKKWLSLIFTRTSGATIELMQRENLMIRRLSPKKINERRADAIGLVVTGPRSLRHLPKKLLKRLSSALTSQLRHVFRSTDKLLTPPFISSH